MLFAWQARFLIPRERKLLRIVIESPDEGRTTTIAQAFVERGQVYAIPSPSVFGDVGPAVAVFELKAMK